MNSISSKYAERVLFKASSLREEIQEVQSLLDRIRRLEKLSKSEAWNNILSKIQENTGLNEYESKEENGLASLENAIEDAISGDDPDYLNWLEYVIMDSLIDEIY